MRFQLSLEYHNKLTEVQYFSEIWRGWTLYLRKPGTVLHLLKRKQQQIKVKSTNIDSQLKPENQFQTWMCIFMFNFINFEQYLFKCLIQ